MKKFTALFLSVTIFILAFTGCDNGVSEEESTTTEVQNSESSGILSDFTTTDIDGNTVDESVFSGKKLTMINIWTTYCGYCIQEMPGLAELNDEYAEKGFQVIGIVTDVVDYHGNFDNNQIELAREIIDETDAEYLHLLPSVSLNQAKLSQVTSVPETIFVDENGNQVGRSYLGARTEQQWKEIVDGLMEIL